MKKFVIDSCVFMKLFLNEEDDEIAEKLIQKIVTNNELIYVPDIFIYEVANITAAQQLDASQVFAILEKHKKSILKVIAPDYDILNQAIKMAKNGNNKSGYPSVYDCSYHALAIKLGCNFVTSDKKHFVKAKKFGFIKLLKEYE